MNNKLTLLIKKQEIFFLLSDMDREKRTITFRMILLFTLKYMLLAMLLALIVSVTYFFKYNVEEALTRVRSLLLIVPLFSLIGFGFYSCVYRLLWNKHILEK